MSAFLLAGVDAAGAAVGGLGLAAMTTLVGGLGLAAMTTLVVGAVVVGAGGLVADDAAGVFALATGAPAGAAVGNVPPVDDGEALARL